MRSSHCTIFVNTEAMYQFFLILGRISDQMTTQPGRPNITESRQDRLTGSAGFPRGPAMRMVTAVTRPSTSAWSG
jgi:hypothetical protein